MQDKEKIREEYILHRKNIFDKEKKSGDIFFKVINLEEYKKSNVIAIYKNFKSEVSTDKIIKYSLDARQDSTSSKSYR